jgi:hypothetical protein
MKESANITISYQLIMMSPFQFTAWKELTTVKTNSTGNYIYIWKSILVEMYLFQASWPGDELTLGNSTLSGLITVTQISKISSNITINVDPKNTTIGSNITINGTITPIRANVTVTIQIRAVNGTGSWNLTAQTKTNGDYEYTWRPDSVGSYRIKASWQGDNMTMPAESETLTVNVEAQGGISGLYVMFGIIVIVLIAVIIFRIKKR